MSLPPRNSVTALTIAGSDSGGGAGVQADLKTFAAHGVHGVCVLTALTAQNTRGVSAIHVPDAAFLRAQLEAVFSDFRVAAVKLGMLAERSVIETVASVLDQARPAHVVLDPVMVATSGARLLAPDALALLKEHLIPRASLITPNLPEAELLLGRPIGSRVQAAAALDELLALFCSHAEPHASRGAPAVLLKGGHAVEARGSAPEQDQDSDDVLDLLACGQQRWQFRHARLALRAHGTGCTLASAIASNLALGLGLAQACEQAVDFVHGALRHAYQPGGSDLAFLDHGWRGR
jgi:hydroxymethylpyrimidine/phosphomethylpyrimidine kinase